ncbi:MAG: NIPSNAP family protein, partial [Alphaproteobacteria bacterium]|nr:NIPSNAP family protein [Alphaproteobacteria bacterium]
QSESGTLNEVVFIWAYDDYGHRQAQRAKLAQDTEWQAFVPTILQYLAHQESCFLTPAAFSPLK